MVNLEAVMESEKLNSSLHLLSREKDSREIQVKSNYDIGLCEAVFPVIGIVTSISYTIRLLADLYQAF